MKHRLFLLGAAALSLLFSCSRAEFEPMDPASGNEKTGRTVLEATAAGDLTPDSKTSFGDKTGNAYPILWSAGDCISVNGVASEELASGGTTTAKFTFDGILDAPFQGVYPASAVNAYFNGEYSVSVPSGQTYTPGQFDPAAGLMLASGSSNLTFKHVMAYLKVTVAGSGSEKIQFISVAARGDENLSGTFAPVFGETPSLTGGADGNDVTLDCGTEGVALGTEFIIPIPARTLASGLCVTVRTTDKKYCVMESTSAFAPEAGKIYKTSFTFVEKGTSVGIWTEEDLIAFLAAADGGVTCSNYYTVKAESEAAFGDISAFVDNGKVNIYSDITLTSKVDWSTSTTKRYNSVSNFRGHLDGHGHTITVAPGTQWLTQMFTNVYGTIENLTFEGSFTASHSPQLGSPIVNVLQEGGVLRNVINKASITYSTASSANYLAIGGVVAYLAGGLIEDCVNKGDINCGGTAGGANVAAAGGVVGWTYQAGGAGVIRNCTNYGSMTLTTVKNGSTPSPIMYYGGVVGYLAQDNMVTCSGCINRGTLDPGTAKYFGGVIGASRSDFSQCHNYGEIIQSSDNVTTEIGGVTAFIGYGHTMSNCNNYGTITAGGSPAVGCVVTRVYGVASDCHNYGTIIFDGNDDTIAGGICRRVERTSNGLGSLENCVNHGNFSVGAKYFGAITSSNQGVMTDCANYGAITFARNNSSTSGIACVNDSEMSGCTNYGPITCDRDYCNIGGVVVANSRNGSYTVGEMDDCHNEGAITVTGHGTLVGGVCFNLRGGTTVSNCTNIGDITFNLAPNTSGEISFAGGIVGLVSEKDFTRIPSYTIFATASDGRYGPASTHTDNVLSAMATISECTNNASIIMTSTPAGGFLRNVALGGVLGWNWAASDATNYLHVYKCVNGTAGTTKGRIEFIQNTASAYIAPLMGGVVGSTAPYNANTNGSCLPYVPGYAQSLNNLGFKSVIEECENYGSIVDMNSWSNGGSSTTHRNLRPHGGIVGAAYGNSDADLHVQVKNCVNAAYILIGNTAATGGSEPAKWKNGDYQSRMNVAGGIVGVGAFVDVEGCTSGYSAASTYGVGSESRYVLASGGIIGAALEKFSVKDCFIHPKMGYLNKPAWTYWGLAVGAVNLGQAGAARSKGYDTLLGSEISGNKVLPVQIKVNGTYLVKAPSTNTINEDNFTDYLISAYDKTNNETNHWVTISGNTWE